MSSCVEVSRAGLRLLGEGGVPDRIGRELCASRLGDRVRGERAVDVLLGPGELRERRRERLLLGRRCTLAGPSSLSSSPGVLFLLQALGVDLDLSCLCGGICANTVATMLLTSLGDSSPCRLAERLRGMSLASFISSA